MFSKDSIFAAAGGGAVVIVLYLLMSGQQDSERAVVKAEHAVESAKFDRDFAAFTGRPADAASAASELESAREKLAAAQAVAERKQAQKSAQEEALLGAARKEVKSDSGGEVDLDATLNKLK